MKKDSTTTKRRLVAAVAALAGIGAAALLSGEDASAGRLLTGKDIANSSLTGKDLRNGTVTSRDLTDGSLSVDDLRAAPDVALLQDGPGDYIEVAGPPGPQGPRGDVGPAGHTGITDLVRRTTASIVAPGSFGTVTTGCTSGTKAITGGVLVDGPAAGVPLNVSAPLDNGAGWQSMVRNTSGTAITVNGWVVCATAF